MLPLWLTNRWVLGGAGVVVLGLAVLLYGAHRERQGRIKEASKQVDEWTQKVERARQEERQHATERLAAYDQLLGQYRVQLEASQARERELVLALRSIQQERRQIVEQVSALPDTALHGYIVSQLGIRPVADATPGFHVEELRAVARCVADYPLCKKEVETLVKQVDEIKNQLAVTQKEVQAWAGKFETLADYTGRLEGFYTTLYNSIPRRRRSWKCLWLWSCGQAAPLPVPEPLTLRRPAP